MSVTDSLCASKAALRISARSQRTTLAAEHDAANATMAGQGLVRHFVAGPELTLSLPPGAVFSAYLPISSEIDPRPLIHHLIAAGLVCVLPVIGDADAPLQFHRWQPGDPLQSGPFDTQEPAADAPQLAPQLLLLPLLAFDAAGHRLGYGGGFYDRTLSALRHAGNGTPPITAVGLAFAGQMVETVPAASTDVPLDWVVTQAGARRFRTIL